MRTLATKSHATPTTGQTAFKRTPDVRRILRGPQVQTKLKIGAVDDPAEREADRVANQVMRMPAKSVQRQADGGPDHIDSVGGICLKSIFGGEVMFVGLSASELAGLAVINEDAGAGLTHPVVNNVWYDCDGFWLRGRAQWFKIPDHCAVEVSGLEPLAYEQCCNAAASLWKEGPHWSSDALDPSKASPF
jgi:hypothetical protein